MSELKTTPDKTLERTIRAGINEANKGHALRTEIPYDKFLDQQDAQNLELKIAQSNTMDELILALENIPGIQGSQKYYSKNELLNLIRTSKPSSLPRTFGLRDKVVSLLETTNKPEGAVPIDNRKPPEPTRNAEIDTALQTQSRDTIFALVNPIGRKIGRILGLSPVLAIQDELVLKLLGYAKPQTGEKRQTTEDHYDILFDKLSNMHLFSDVEQLIKEKSRDIASPAFKNKERIAAQNLIAEARLRWLQHQMVDRKRE